MTSLCVRHLEIGEEVPIGRRAVEEPWGLTDVCDPCWFVLRQEAWNAWNTAVRNGRFSPPEACVDCKRIGKKLTAHHVNYRDPYDTVWVCSTCHGKRHREHKAEHAKAE